MEYKEAPSIENAERRLIFPVISWLTKKKFEEYVKLQTRSSSNIHPYLNQLDDVDSIDNRIFVGKSIPYKNNTGAFNLEILGLVMKNKKNEWQLNISYSSSVIEIQNDFLVLNIEDENSFCWIETSSDSIPKYALRGAIDEQSREYLYIGKFNSKFLNTNNQVKFYSNFTMNPFNEFIPNLFGKIHRSHKCLYAPYNKMELIFNSYSILCLRPSPAPLKILCRSLIRSMTNNSNKNMELINKNSNGKKYVPESIIINFLKFPSYLSVGEYMLKNEKIVRQDGKFELLIENNGELICKSLITEDKNLNKEELDNIEVTQIKRFIYPEIDSIWLHRFQVVFYQTNKRVRLFHSFYENSPEYKLFIQENNETPNLEVSE